MAPINPTWTRGRAIKDNRQAGTEYRSLPDNPHLERSTALCDLKLMASHDVPVVQRNVRYGVGLFSGS
jgi:hypothetical protein